MTAREIINQGWEECDAPLPTGDWVQTGKATGVIAYEKCSDPNVRIYIEMSKVVFNGEGHGPTIKEMLRNGIATYIKPKRVAFP